MSHGNSLTHTRPPRRARSRFKLRVMAMAMMFMFNRGHWKKFAMEADGPTVAATDKNGQPSYGVDGADETRFQPIF